MASTAYTILDRLVSLNDPTIDDVNAAVEELRHHFQSKFQEELTTVERYHQLRSNRIEEELQTTKRRYESTMDNLKKDFQTKLDTAKKDYLTPWSAARFEHARRLSRFSRQQYIKDLRSETNRVVEVAAEERQLAGPTTSTDTKTDDNGTKRKRKGEELTSVSKRTKKTTA